MYRQISNAARWSKGIKRISLSQPCSNIRDLQNSARSQASTPYPIRSSKISHHSEYLFRTAAIFCVFSSTQRRKFFCISPRIQPPVSLSEYPPRTKKVGWRSLARNSLSSKVVSIVIVVADLLFRGLSRNVCRHWHSAGLRRFQAGIGRSTLYVTNQLSSAADFNRNLVIC